MESAIHEQAPAWMHVSRLGDLKHSCDLGTREWDPDARWTRVFSGDSTPTVAASGWTQHQDTLQSLFGGDASLNRAGAELIEEVTDLCLDSLERILVSIRASEADEAPEMDGLRGLGRTMHHSTRKLPPESITPFQLYRNRLQYWMQSDVHVDPGPWGEDVWQSADPMGNDVKYSLPI